MELIIHFVYCLNAPQVCDLLQYLRRVKVKKIVVIYLQISFESI